MSDKSKRGSSICIISYSFSLHFQKSFFPFSVYSYLNFLCLYHFLSLLICSFSLPFLLLTLLPFLSFLYSSFLLFQSIYTFWMCFVSFILFRARHNLVRLGKRKNVRVRVWPKKEFSWTKKMKKKKEKLGENLQKNSWKESLFKIFVNE